MTIRLAKVLDDRGMSKAELARRTGLSYPGIKCLFNRRSKLPRRKNLTVIALAVRWPEERAAELFEEVDE